MNSRYSVSAALAVSTLWMAAAHAADRAPDTRWQARVQLSTTEPGLARGSQLLSANLLGDYYFSGTRLGGLRATGGMLLGPNSLTFTSPGASLGTASRMTIGNRRIGLGETQWLEPVSTHTYLGLGYSRHFPRSGFSFSADLGLTYGLGTTMRLGQSTAQALEDAARDLRFKPLLQIGLSYSY